MQVQFGFAPGVMARTVWACSQRCIDLAAKLYGKEATMTEHEKQARQDAGKVAGSYLDKIGKTDLGALSKEEWDTFLEALFETYHEGLIELAGKEAPF